jgi:DNA repair protein RecO (recombination protein O)
MPTLKDEAICVRRMDWSETSQIVVLLTGSHGKISAVAKGAKRRQPSTLARFSGGVELLSAGRAVLLTKERPGLANLIEWDLLDPHWHLRQDWRAYRLAMYAADLVHHLMREHDPHPATYQALRTLLGALAERAEHPAALLRFQWILAADLGYRPVLDRDAETGAALEEDAATLGFSPSTGGVVADTGERDRWRVRRGTIRLLRDVAAGNDLGGAKEQSLWRANRLLCAYFRYLLEKQLPTMDVLLGRSAWG